MNVRVRRSRVSFSSTSSTPSHRSGTLSRIFVSAWSTYSLLLIDTHAAASQPLQSQRARQHRRHRPCREPDAYTDGRRRGAGRRVCARGDEVRALFRTFAGLLLPQVPAPLRLHACANRSIDRFFLRSRPDLIDSALLRPGRLDKSLLCDMPDAEERKEVRQCSRFSGQTGRHGILSSLADRPRPDAALRAWAYFPTTGITRNFR